MTTHDSATTAHDSAAAIPESTIAESVVPGAGTAGDAFPDGDTGPRQEGFQSRLPDLTTLYPDLAVLSGSVHKAVRNGPVPQSTVTLMLLRAAQIVGSTYHCIRITDGLRKAGEEERRITAIATWQDAPYFSGAERIALELAEAVLTPNPFGERVSDDLFARASRHYNDEEIWHLTIALGHLGMFIPVALIAKPIPGRPPGKNYSK
ncbi:carboxymuconolactone decarboxylase family protein [Streptomyces sp. NA04227]|uniref:carboxymuconolactone decarboxylase family protein n=1 Tax=Streptomyces sp. NA04227 TaxID=2742136 RepID=UPI0015909CF6|nr:carboxymuconolactone decarboxylase family protein [Streptomyces sp. NA04227]QKW06289.1 carboxymuconolactone decarboxylase family protein [Streptomyces sp. NA04227]